MYFRTKTIVKTLTAILMAMIIAVIPPFSVDSNAKGSKSSTDFEEYTDSGNSGRIGCCRLYKEEESLI